MANDYIDKIKKGDKEYLLHADPEQIKDYLGVEFKYGYYIFNNEDNVFIHVEDIPSDYSGLAYGFYEDGLEIAYFDKGNSVSNSHLVAGGISISDEGDNPREVALTPDGVDKLNYASLTHSFNELDPTLKQIVEDAIKDDNTHGVSCSLAQWETIKALLDKSLFINYGEYSLIKVANNGINAYQFGSRTGLVVSAGIELFYVESETKLFASFNEI